MLSNNSKLLNIVILKIFLIRFRHKTLKFTPKVVNEFPSEGVVSATLGWQIASSRDSFCDFEETQAILVCLFVTCVVLPRTHKDKS